MMNMNYNENEYIKRANRKYIINFVIGFVISVIIVVILFLKF